MNRKSENIQILRENVRDDEKEKLEQVYW